MKNTQYVNVGLQGTVTQRNRKILKTEKLLKTQRNSSEVEEENNVNSIVNHFDL